jgi:hypothetical protein
MKHLKYILFIMATMSLSACCASNKSTENCEITKVLKVIENNESYYMQVRFNHCTSKEARESLIKEELINRFPLIRTKTVKVEEYLGKMYNEYKYEIKVEQTEDSLLLNETEGAYLNKIFETNRNDFDFTNKKVGFIRNGGNGKIHYFDMHEKHSTNANSPCDNGTLYIFNAEQKAESGGYDAAIVYWSKFAVPVEKVIKRLKNQRQKRL